MRSIRKKAESHYTRKAVTSKFVGFFTRHYQNYHQSISCQLTYYLFQCYIHYTQRRDEE